MTIPYQYKDLGILVLNVMKTKNATLFTMIFLFVVFSIVSIPSYTYSNPKYTQSGFKGGFFGGTTGTDYVFDKNFCRAGQDFILQIDPLGCTPPVVRSDLLEEQNVYVFCPILATKINPLIDIEAIDWIVLSKKEFSKDISNIGFHPARSALGVQDHLNSPVLSNIGYAVLELRRNPREADMPEYIEGNLTAKIRYDIKNTYGVGGAKFYLRQTDESQWDEVFSRYGFWKGRGFLRAENIENDRATISIYSGQTRVLGPKSYQQKLARFNLQKGQTSNLVYLPTFDYCMGGVKVRLDNIENPDTTAKFIINDDEYEVKKGEKFLDDRCSVVSLLKQGIYQKSQIRCAEDEETNRYDLIISPNITLNFGGDDLSYEIGSWLYDGDGKSVYLAHAGTKDDIIDEEHLYIYLVAIPEKKDRLSDEQLISYDGYIRREESNSIIGIGSFVEGVGRDWVKGENFIKIKHSQQGTFKGQNVLFKGLLGIYDTTLAPEVSNYYENAMNDFSTIINSFSYEKEFEYSASYGERALAEKIKLANELNKKQTTLQLCEEFRKNYPKPQVEISDICNDKLEFSNSASSTAFVFINNEIKEINFKGIYEPTKKDYSAEIVISSPGKEPELIQLGKDEIVYLEGGETISEVISTIYVSGSCELKGTAKENGIKVFEFLVNEENGFTPEAASGIIGNLVQESGVNPERVQGTQTPRDDKKSMDIDGKTGYGIMQWTDKSRQQGLRDFAQQKKTVDGDLQTQMEFMIKEMKEFKVNGNSVYDEIKVMTNINEATILFEDKMEKAGTPEMDKRKKYALQAYRCFNAKQFVWPSESKRVTSCFGERNSKTHSGIDIGALNPGQIDDKIYSIADGRIKSICKDNSCGDYGNNVVIDHGIYTAIYAHLNNVENDISSGKNVEKGDTIGEMGDTGDSSGVHLHLGIYETKENPTASHSTGSINPLCFLEDKEVTFENSNCKSTFEENTKDCGGIVTSITTTTTTTKAGTSYIQLKDLAPEYATIKTSSDANARLIKNEPKVIGNYTFTLKEINLNQVAKVSVISDINYADSNATFSYKIGIEKRAIQLAPDKIREKIKKQEEQIKKWEEISNALAKSVKTFKSACLATGTALTLKNFVENAQGKGIARQKVMRGKGGWYEICKEKVERGEFRSQDTCLLENADEINSDVNELNEIIKEQNEKIKLLQTYQEKAFLGEKVVNEEDFVEKYSSQVKAKLPSGSFSDQSGKNYISAGDIESVLNYDGFNKGYYDIEELRDIELYSALLEKNPNSNMAKRELYSIFSEIKERSENYEITTSIQEEIENLGFSDVDIHSYGNENAIVGIYSGLTIQGNKIIGATNLDNDKIYPIEIITYNNQKYLLILEGQTPNYFIKDGENGVYEYENVANNQINVKPASNPDKILMAFSGFKKYDRSFYENEFSEPEVRFYETAPYKGLPAVVPFDLNNGWYAAVKSTLPVGGNIRTYDESGRVNSFYLCNVGENKREEFLRGDDICQMINLQTSKTYEQFNGLQKEEVDSLVRDAVKVIEQVSRQYKTGITNVLVDTRQGRKNIKVGPPALEIPDIQCQDFMSPKDCNVIFNLCDPVMCPSSRCNFGGKYNVRDVTQTGIVGSIALCLPNSKFLGGDVYVPVCLTGVKAGIDNWISVKKSYRDCLKENLETGATIGICDEMHSVYMCDFFWRQALPITKYAFPKIVSTILGQNTRGGGEYLGFEHAWKSMGGAVDYFVQDYGANVYTAFKSRSKEKISSTEVCKKAISIGGSNVETIFDSLTEPDSPAQFHGRFDEISLTTSTVPPTSHYKVFYHIYAGNDRGAYYQVYLRQRGESFYQDAPYNRIVGAGYIAVGQYTSNTTDFTAPSGYSELCIMVNGQEECGFKEVSTSLAVDYLQELYVKDQANNKNIKSESECISGTPSLYNAINPNMQSAVEGAINPAVYQRGLIRVCATKNPGQGTDAFAGRENSRWKEVGYCGDKKIKCWLDTQSVKDIINSPDLAKFLINGTTENLRESALDEISENVLEYLKKENYTTNVGPLIDEIKNNNDETEEGLNKRIKLINYLLENVYFNKDRAMLYFFRGETYAQLAKLAYSKWKASLP